jgi:hypothetical protein
MPRRETGLADREPPGPEIELGVERVGRLRHVREQQLEHHLLTGDRAWAVGRHLHAFGRISAARWGQHALALDLDHAAAAVAVRPHPFLVTKVWDLDAVACGRVDEALVRTAADRGAVQGERDWLRRRLRVGRASDDCFYSHAIPFT